MPKKKEPKSMGELLAGSGGSPGSFSRGETVIGKILEIGRRSIAVDIGGKAEGIISDRDFENLKEYLLTLKVGDKIEAQVLVPETPEGTVVLTLRAQAQKESWDRLMERFETGVQVDATVRSSSSSGLFVDILGQSAFVPQSQISKKILKNLLALVGKKVKVKIIEIDAEKRRIVASERAVSEKELIEKQTEAFSHLSEGEELLGEVVNTTPFGAFVRVEIGSGKKKVSVEGLVHLSELSYEKIDTVEKVVKVGDRVRVLVLGVEKEPRGITRLSLSIKRMTKEPFEEFIKKYKKDDSVSGRITRMTDYGAFVELVPGVEGLLHLSKIPPATVLKEADRLDCTIEEIDIENKKVSLGVLLKAKPIGYK